MPWNIDLNINNERQDCKVGIVWGNVRGGGIKEIKMRIHGE
jgi:hypothetical protein